MHPEIAAYMKCGMHLKHMVHKINIYIICYIEHGSMLDEIGMGKYVFSCAVLLKDKLFETKGKIP